MLTKHNFYTYVIIKWCTGNGDTLIFHCKQATNINTNKLHDAFRSHESIVYVNFMRVLITLLKIEWADDSRRLKKWGEMNAAQQSYESVYAGKTIFIRRNNIDT